MLGIGKVQICNMALAYSGGGQISAFDEATEQGRLCRVWYDLARQETLQQADWSFARMKQTLASHADAPPQSWAFRYITPADLVAIRYLAKPSTTDVEDEIAYEMLLDDAGNVVTLCTDLDEAAAIYTRNQESVVLFSPMFVDALAMVLAGKLIIPMSEDIEKAEGFIKTIPNAVQKAHALDLMQGQPKAERDASYIRARG
tara:strand:- start:4393 stop:4995 length:603 start_codon:yes stop_codon:yes gene_type:complete